MLNFLRSRATALATIVLLLQAGLYYSMSRTETIPNTEPWSEFPRDIGAWKTISETPMDPEVVAKLQPDDYINRTYAIPNDTSPQQSLFIGYFKTQRKGLAPHSPKACLPSAGWTPVSSEVRTLDIAGESIPLNVYVVEKQNNRMLVLYWYQQGKRAFANEYRAQIYAVPQLFLHGRTDIALVRVILSLGPNQLDSGTTEGMSFVRQIYPLVLNHIP